MIAEAQLILRDRRLQIDAYIWDYAQGARFLRQFSGTPPSLLILRPGISIKGGAFRCVRPTGYERSSRPSRSRMSN